MMYNGPKHIKYKKVRKGSLKRLEFKTNKIIHGTIALKTLESGILSAKQLEASKLIIIKKIKKKGKLWIKVFPNLPITSKSIGTRMGKGKGQISHWGARIAAGTILFEYSGINLKLGVSALKTGGAKLSIKTKIFD